MEERAMLERILGNASKFDRITKERKRAQLTALLEGIKNSQAEVIAELELLRKDDVKVSFSLSGVENAGVEKTRVDSRDGKCRSGNAGVT